MLQIGGIGLSSYLINSAGAVAWLPDGEHVAIAQKLQAGNTHNLTQRELDLVKNIVTVLRENKGF